MHLWNDYEGKTIADVYTVGSLLRSEGRSALFALTKGPEAPAMIRITESINDEGQMLKCWRSVAELKHESILGMKQFGETTFEGTPLTYAVLECPDASLAELLSDRALTREEALQIAESLTAGLTALHEGNLVHGHVEPSTVLAVGETVKLRADCVRECVVDSEFMTAEDCAKLRQQDVQALGELLLRGLTLQRALLPGMKLPTPFDRIVPRAMEGSMSLAEIAAAVRPAQATAVAPSMVAVQTPVNSEPAAKPASSAVAEPAAKSTVVRESISAGSTGPSAVETAMLYRRRVDEDAAKGAGKVPLRIAVGAAAALSLALLVHVFHGKPEAKTAEVAATSPIATQPTQVAANDTRTQQATNTPTASSSTAANPVRPGWYVIAYTFNHQEQAWRRASAILKAHPSLHPQVIAPHGQYLVALGGAMSRDEAENVRDIARRAGMPRDTFVRNYKGV